MKNNKAFTLIEVMVVVAIIGILVSLVMPNLLRAKMESNHTFAKATLNTIGKALEIYANSNNGNYPNDINSLFSEDYIRKDYFLETYRGYDYESELSGGTYKITATPSNENAKTFTLTTGSIIK